MNFIDEAELVKIITKLDFYINEEQINRRALFDTIDIMKSKYLTQNTDKLQQFINDLDYNSRVIKETHEDYVAVFRKNIDKYNNMRQQVEIKFEDIG